MKVQIVILEKNYFPHYCGEILSPTCFIQMLWIRKWLISKKKVWLLSSFAISMKTTGVISLKVWNTIVWTKGLMQCYVENTSWKNRNTEFQSCRIIYHISPKHHMEVPCHHHLSSADHAGGGCFIKRAQYKAFC